MIFFTFQKGIRFTTILHEWLQQYNDVFHPKQLFSLGMGTASGHVFVKVRMCGNLRVLNCNNFRARPHLVFGQLVERETSIHSWKPVSVSWNHGSMSSDVCWMQLMNCKHWCKKLRDGNELWAIKPLAPLIAHNLFDIII